MKTLLRQFIILFPNLWLEVVMIGGNFVVAIIPATNLTDQTNMIL